MMTPKESEKSSRKIGLYDILGVLACAAWLGILVFLYMNRPEISFLLRLPAVIFLAVAGAAACFLLLWRPIVEDSGIGVSHEDFGSALRAQKITAMYVSIPGLNRTARKEIVPAAITAGVIFLLGITPAGPFKSPEVRLPDPVMLISRDILRPMLLLAGDSLAVLAPAALSPQTESWEKVFPENTPATKLTRMIFQGKYRDAADLGSVTAGTPEGSDPVFRRVYAQALLLAGDYKKAVEQFLSLRESFPSAPEITLQTALAYMYLGEMENAKKMLDAAGTEIKHDDFSRPEMIVEYLRAVHAVLSGKGLKKADDVMKRLWDAQCEAYVKSFGDETAETGESAAADTSGKESGKKKSGKTSDADPLKTVSDAVRNAKNSGRSASEAQARATADLAADLMVLNNNHAVLLAMTGSYSGAYGETDWAKTLADEYSGGTRRLSRVITASAWNTQGMILAVFEKHGENPADDSSPKAPAKTPAKASPKDEEPSDTPAGRAAKIFASAPLPTECFEKASRIFVELGEGENAVSRIILQSNLLTYYARSEFSTPAVPTQKDFLQTAEAPLGVIRNVAQEQNKRLEAGISPEEMPVWLIAAQNALMDYYANVDGRDGNVKQCYDTAVRVAMKKLTPDSLTEIAVRTRYIEMRLAARFARSAALGSLKDTKTLLDETLRTAKKELPPEHPLLARLLVANARMMLVGDQLKDADAAVKEALAVYEKKELPKNHSGKLLADLTAFTVKHSAPESAVDRDPEILAEFQILQNRFIDAFGGFSLPVAQTYREMGYLCVLQNSPKNARDAYTRALNIYTRIYDEKTAHPSVSAMKEMIQKLTPEAK